MAQPRSPREVFLALVTGIADGNPAGLPELYAEQIDVVHPFDPLHGAPLRSREELRERMKSFAAPATTTTISPRPRSQASSVTSSQRSARRRPPQARQADTQRPPRTHKPAACPCSPSRAPDQP
jgi:hypothetical protein